MDTSNSINLEDDENQANMEGLQKQESECKSLVKHKNELLAILLVVIMFMNHVVNRTIVAVHMFPSPQVLTMGHLATNVLAVWVARRLRLVRSQTLDVRLARRLLPLFFCFCGSLVIFSARINFHLPAISISRQFNVLMIKLLESYILGETITHRLVQKVCIVVMASGAFVVTFSQSWSWYTYVIVILDNTILATNFLFLREILNCKAFGICDLLMYDSLFRLVPALCAAWYTNALAKTAIFMDYMNDDSYLLCHLSVSCLLGLAQSLCTLACIDHNGALATAVQAALSDIVLTHSEWLIVSGWKMFHWISLVGFLTSVCGSLLFIYVTLKRKPTDRYDWVQEINVL